MKRALASGLGSQMATTSATSLMYWARKGEKLPVPSMPKRTRWLIGDTPVFQSQKGSSGRVDALPPPFFSVVAAYAAPDWKSLR